MTKKKRVDEKVQIFTISMFDGSFPKTKSKVTIKKSRKTQKKRDVELELHNTQMDMVQ
jgi:hypothetical protein